MRVEKAIKVEKKRLYSFVILAESYEADIHLAAMGYLIPIVDDAIDCILSLRIGSCFEVYSPTRVKSAKCHQNVLEFRVIDS
jgi:hypothetical protein